MRPPILPRTDSRSLRVCVDRGQHRVLGRHPAEPAALAPPRDTLGEGRRAEHPGPPELDEHRALGMLAPVAGERRPGGAGRPFGRRRASCAAGYRPTSTISRGSPASIGPSKTAVASATRDIRVVPRRHVREHEASDPAPAAPPRRPRVRSGGGRRGCPRRRRTTPRQSSRSAPSRELRRSPGTGRCRRCRRAPRPSTSSRTAYASTGWATRSARTRNGPTGRRDRRGRGSRTRSVIPAASSCRRRGPAGRRVSVGP